MTMTLDSREVELIATILDAYSIIASIVDQKLYDEVAHLRNKMLEMKERMRYDGCDCMRADFDESRPLAFNRAIYVATVE